MTDIKAINQTETDSITSQNETNNYLDLANVMFVIINSDQTIRFVNKKCCEVLGYSKSEILGSNWFNLVLPANLREEVRAVFMNIMREEIESSEYFENPVLTKQGEIRLIAWRNSLLRDSSGKPDATISSGEDITRRRESELRMIDSEERFKSLFNYAGFGIMMLDPQGRIIQSNPASQRILGHSAAFPAEITINKFVKPEELEAFQSIQHEMIKNKRDIYKAEKALHKLDGSSIWVDLTLSPVRNDSGEVVFIIAMLDDMTQRKKAEEALQRSEEKYRNFFEEDLTGDYISTADGRILICNMAFCRIFGFESMEEAKSTNLIKLYPDPMQRLNLLAEIQKKRRMENHELKLQSCRGEARYLMANLIGIFDSQNYLTGIKGYLYDISEHKKIEAQFRQAQKMEAVGRLAGGVAHDFNNLLSVINGYSHLLLERVSPDDPLRHQIEMIQKAGQRAESLTRQLLAFSRRQVMQTKNLNLNDLVNDIEKLLNRVIGEDIQLLTRVSPNLKLINADPSQMEQVIMNLVLNARDAMPDGGVLTIETSNIILNENYIRRHPLMQPGSYVMLAVSDTGTGMSQEIQANLFEPFFTTKPSGKGTGLGLSTVYGIVKQSGGFIWVYSEVAKGTTFKIYLPVVDGDKTEIQNFAAEKTTMVGSETILIAEDDRDVRDLIESLLNDHGYSTLAATNGDEALKIASTHPVPIHLMITDVVMPNLNGSDVARKLTATRPAMKVLYVSGYTDDAIVHHGILDKDVHFLQKPFNTVELLRRVRQILDA